MRFLLRVFVVITLLTIELASVYAVLNPHITPEYRAYYIDQKTTDWQNIHYRASLEEGIAFSRPGWPEFVSSTKGVSFREDWGRWTDAALTPVASIQFKDAIKGPVCVDIRAQSSPTEIGKSVEVRLGDESKTMVFTAPGLEEKRLDFEAHTPTNVLSFQFPTPIPRISDVYKQSLDRRRLGVGFESLQIFQGHCKTSGPGA